MDFGLRPEQEAVRDAARRFAQERLAPLYATHDRSGKFDRRLIAEMGALGLIAPELPQDCGGLGLDYLTSGLVMEEIAAGDFNLAYIPRELYAILFQGPILLNSFPYFKPNWMGLGLFFTTPAFLLIFKGPWNRLSKEAAIAAACILPILITHGEVGFTQFGYRFSLDFTPFLMLLTAKGMSENLSWQEKALIILCLLINFWGVVAIIKFNFVSF